MIAVDSKQINFVTKSKNEIKFGKYDAFDPDNHCMMIGDEFKTYLI